MICTRERSQEIPAAGDAGDGTVETMDSSQGGAVDASSVPAGRAETVETVDSSQGGAVDGSSVPAERAEIDSGTSAASGTDQGNGDDPPAVLSMRAAHKLSNWGRLPLTVRGRTRGQSQCLQSENARLQCAIEDAMSAAVQKWTESGSILEGISWTTEDTMAMIAGAPAVEENKEEMSVCMPSGFPEDVEPRPQLVANVQRSKYKASWREAMKNELDGHQTTGMYEAATPLRRRKPVGAKWVLS